MKITLVRAEEQMRQKRGKDGLTEIVSRLLCSGYIAFESESRQKDWRMPGSAAHPKSTLSSYSENLVATHLCIGLANPPHAYNVFA